MKVRQSKKSFWWTLGLCFIFICALVLLLPVFFRADYQALSQVPEKSLATSTFIPTHVQTPNPLKAIYMTACVASGKAARERLVSLIGATELNSVVIDVKDYSGTISFESSDPAIASNAGGGCRSSDMAQFIDELHHKNVYVIGRITVFQDPYYTKIHPELAVKKLSDGSVWTDYKGLAFIDVGARPYWDYIVNLAKSSYNIGFDEINFDYIRYPSDGDMKNTSYTWTVGTSTKALMLKGFFSYLSENLKSINLKTSADLFGLTTLAADDMGIGQVLENALPYFDYVDPMVYPSHFAPSTAGFANPAEHPYDIIKYSMGSGVVRERNLRIVEGLATSTPSKLRPWLQDFNLGAPYGVPEVEAQIKATYDVGLNSWLLWDAANRYTPAALLPEK